MNLAPTQDEITRPAWAEVWRQRLLLALWAAVALAYVAVFVLDLRVSYGLLAAPCAGPGCHYQAIGVTEAAVLVGWGLSVPIYALTMLGVSVLPVLAFTALGLIMLARLYPQPRSYLYALMPVTMPILAITNFDVLIAAYPGLTIPVQLMVILGHLLLVTFALISPRSRFDPRWTAVLPIVAAAVGVYSAFFADRLTLPVTQPYAILLLVIAVIILYRYRRLFNDTERRQTKWVVLGLLVFFAGVPLWSYTFEIATPAAGRDTLVTLLGGWTLLMLITLVLPVAIFIAIFRHQLWDIDLIINRTLVYGGLSAGIVIVYALVVGGLGALFHTQGNFALTLLATGLIAVLFQPARERLQRTVNRLMFGERDDPYAVLSSLGRRLQDTTIPDQTLAAIAAAITQSLKLPYAAIEVETDEGEHRTLAADGQRPPQVEEWPLRYQGQIIGRLLVGPRSPGEAFTGHERQLLGDIASQAGAATYAARLTTALQRSRERLVLAREEERRRIRRDLHDELGPTLASHTFKLDTALDLLDSDPAAVAALLQALKAQNQALVGDIRRLVYELRPPALDELGLQGALSAHFGQTTAPVVTVAATPDPLPPLPAAVEVAAYRIALEAVNNALRHAQADACAVALLVADAWLTLTVTDDGVGLSAGNALGIGLQSMRERAEEVGGTLTVETLSRRGARVTARLPLALAH
jgi:signal transduction histidine kinase